jgi:nitrate reductase / nitrite oxidoreductase, alpha subunit
MARRNLLSSLRWLRAATDSDACRSEKISDDLAEIRCGNREWEDLYRRRWQYDKRVRSTHGVNCTGSCSWEVYVKDGIIISELQAADYPACGYDFPDHEPRGCPRGATYSWYIYSPLRLKYPLIRSTLLEMWREALKSQPPEGVRGAGHHSSGSDPVAAWQRLVEDPAKRKAYQQARGKGGFVRVSHDEAATLIAASLVHTIKKYGPDRIFGFTPIPAMSMVGYSSGARFLSLISGSHVCF